MSNWSKANFQTRPPFDSFFLGGFECSTHKTRAGRRLDLISATNHDVFAAADYALLKTQGIRTVREGLRWHLIERSPGCYDFSSVLPILAAARGAGVQIIWDLCHYGWPEDLDIFSAQFVKRFASFARAFAVLLAAETDQVPYCAPINEISFFSWACAEAGIFYPYAQGRGSELKMQLVRAAIEGAEAIWAVNAQARMVQIDPLVNVIADSPHMEIRRAAERYRLSQFEAWDMLAGRLRPQLGGRPEHLDIIGVNYYPHNQWLWPDRQMVSRDDPLYRPLRDLLREIYARYRRPLFIAETGTEGDERPGWLRYVGDEVRAALRAGVPVGGICLYPILNHPGWEDDRHCHNGLWDYADESGRREICEPLAREMRNQIMLIEQEAEASLGTALFPKEAA